MKKSVNGIYANNNDLLFKNPFIIKLNKLVMKELIIFINIIIKIEII